MSYILDALKKAQHHQGEGVSIDAAPRPVGISVKWIWALGGALSLSLAVLAWALLVREPGDAAQVVQSSANPAAATTTRPVTRPASRPTNRPANRPQTMPPTTNRPERQAATATQQSPATNQPTRRPTPKPARRPAATKVELSELSAADQAKFTDLNVTSHIYTEDPTLCAIVVDGQRLRNGDTIHGLVVHEITPTGVVFRDAQARLVTVNPFE